MWPSPLHGRQGARNRRAHPRHTPTPNPLGDSLVLIAITHRIPTCTVASLLMPSLCTSPPPPPVINTHPETIHVRPSPTGPNSYFPPDPHNDPSARSRSRSMRSSKRPQVSLQMIYAPPPPAPLSSQSQSAPVSPIGEGFPAPLNRRPHCHILVQLSRLPRSTASHLPLRHSRVATSSSANRLKQDPLPYTLLLEQSFLSPSPGAAVQQPWTTTHFVPFRVDGAAPPSSFLTCRLLFSHRSASSFAVRLTTK